MIPYKIRSIPLLNVVKDIRAKRLVPDAYFQRNLVWRDIHKRDFVATILKGYPFPQMFFSRGKVDVERMDTTSCIVDGQQRANAIVEFVDNKFPVEGRYFKDLNENEQEAFLNYDIGVVELEIANDDPQIKDLFQRVNRTSTSLTSIEKLASQYGATEYMLVARLLAGDVDVTKAQAQAESEDEDWTLDPAIPQSFLDWAATKDVGLFDDAARQLRIFSDREVSRKVHILYVLNIASTLVGGFFNRNEKTHELLDDYKENFPEKDLVVRAISEACAVVKALNLPDDSIWTNKANFFSLLVALSGRIMKDAPINHDGLKDRLVAFSNAPPNDYQAAARDSVNDKRQRQIRNKYVQDLL